jgi:UDP-2,4-diacetamido-2,4,6-trideoxy-beta-L-altropyranose hydrolase
MTEGKKKPLVLIRTDGNNLIGMGHIFRTIGIAEKLKSKGFDICYLIPEDKIIIDKIKSFGKYYVTNNNEINELTLIKKIQPEIFILDILKKYFKFSKNYFKIIKKVSTLFVTIDYVSKEIQYADLAIHSLFNPKKFKTSRTIFDLKYAIVRKKILLSRKNFLFKKHINSILILQGGADTLCISPKIIKSIKNLSEDFRITVIIGPNFKNIEEINDLIRDTKIKILKDVKNIGDVMANHDVAITAAGNTVIELLTIGVPSVIICADRHEIEFAQFLEKKKLVINLGFGKKITQKNIRESIYKLQNNFNLRNQLHFNSIKTFDGKGVDRTGKLIIEKYLELLKYKKIVK